MKPNRPSEAIFADGRGKPKALAIHPEAIGVTYPVMDVKEVRCAEVVQGIAVLSIDGPLEHKGGSYWSYWQSYEELAKDFKSLIDCAEVSAIIMKFDSPGGEVSGLNETVAILKEMKEESGKKVIAYVDEACYSAAYALAMVADEIFLPESGGVGSIGVITAMADCTEADKKAGYRIEVIASGAKKTDGHPHVKLTDGAIKRTQRNVDKLANSFFELVSESRGLSVETIASYQAGTFSGQEAVDSGLADGVLSLEECLTLAKEQFSTEANSSRSDGKGKAQMGQIAAAKALKDAQAAMSAAKSDSDRAICAARIVAAEASLATFAKVKKTKTVTTDTHEEEVDDGEPEDDDKTDNEDTEDSSYSDDADEDAEMEDEEKKSLRSDSAKTGLYTKDRLLRLARQIVGGPTSGPSRKSIEEVMGALHAMWQSHKGHSKLAAEVKQLKADAEKSKVSSMVSAGVKAGKIAPSQKQWALSQSPVGLKAYLDAAPKMVHTGDEELTESRIAGVGTGGVTAEMAKIWVKQGFTEKDFPKLVEKLNIANKMNGAS